MENLDKQNVRSLDLETKEALSKEGIDPTHAACGVFEDGKHYQIGLYAGGRFVCYCDGHYFRLMTPAQARRMFK